MKMTDTWQWPWICDLDSLSPHIIEIEVNVVLLENAL